MGLNGKNREFTLLNFMIQTHFQEHIPFIMWGHGVIVLKKTIHHVDTWPKSVLQQCRHSKISIYGIWTTGHKMNIMYWVYSGHVRKRYSQMGAKLAKLRNCKKLHNGNLLMYALPTIGWLYQEVWEDMGMHKIPRNRIYSVYTVCPQSPFRVLKNCGA
jgi:hypothetical protein